MVRNLFDVYGCPLCEREVATETGTKKEFVCCDLPMRLVRENSEYEKLDSAEWPADKLSAVVAEEVGYSDNAVVGKMLVSTPAMEVRVLTFREGQETVYEKAKHDASLFIIEGDGILALGYEDIELVRSSVAIIPRGMLWGVKNTGNSTMVALQTVSKNSSE